MDPGHAAAAVLAATAQVTLVVLAARLARDAHRADDVSRDEVPWALPAAAATLVGIAALLRLGRWVTGTIPSMPELVLTLGAEIGAGALLVTFFRRAHPVHHGRPAMGTTAAGAILLATAVASVLFHKTDMSFLVGIHAAIAVAWGLLAWAFSDLAAFLRADDALPRWLPALTTAGAHVLVATAYARVLVMNGVIATGEFGPGSRLVHATGLLVATALAAPGLRAAIRVFHDAHDEATAASAPTAAPPDA